MNGAVRLSLELAMRPKWTVAVWTGRQIALEFLERLFDLGKLDVTEPPFQSNCSDDTGV